MTMMIYENGMSSASYMHSRKPCWLTLKKEQASVKAKIRHGGEAYITTEAVVQYKQKVLSFSR
jgi:hypothetical protein